MCGTSHDPREGLWMIKISKNLPPTKLDLHKVLKIHEFFFGNPQNFFVFVSQCKQRENVNNQNRRWAKRPKSLVKNK